MTTQDPRLTQDDDGTRRYEGRVLAHQDEPLADQGLGFDLETLERRRRRTITRRSTLAALGSGAAAVGLAACSAGADGSAGAASDGGGSSSEEIPEETAGPYPGDGSNGPDVLSESGVVRSDITSSFGDGTMTAEGVPITLTLSITDLSADGAPYEGVAVYVWHCTADGRYSLYADSLEDENFLRGVQVAGEDGTVTFQSIMPGCYAGRWPHIHFEVYPDQESITDTSTLLATSQVAIPQDVAETVYALEEYAGSSENLAGVSLESDNVFGDDGGELQLAAVEGDAETGYTVQLPVAIDPTTEPEQSGQAPEMGGGPSDAGGEPPAGGMPPGDGEMPSGTPSDGGGSPSAQGDIVGGSLVGSR